jgi:hypothetical protein
MDVRKQLHFLITLKSLKILHVFAAGLYGFTLITSRKLANIFLRISKLKVKNPFQQPLKIEQFIKKCPTVDKEHCSKSGET